MKWFVMVGCGLVAAVVGVAAVGNRAADGDLSVTDPLGSRQGGELTAEIRAAAERSRVKAEVTAALVRGEVSLDEAVAVFRKTLAADPAVWNRLRQDWPRASERELVLRNLTAFVRWQSDADAERVPAVLARLAVAIGRAAESPDPRTAVVTVQ